MKLFGTKCNNAENRFLRGRDKTTGPRDFICYGTLCSVVNVVPKCLDAYTMHETNSPTFVPKKHATGKPVQYLLTRNGNEGKLENTDAV